MPAFSHSLRFLSNSIMFVAPRYKIGLTPCSAAVANNVVIGDSRVCPDANHIGSSIIQKSSSSCVAITALSVNIISLSKTVYFRFVSCKCLATGFSYSDSFCCVLSVVLSPKISMF